MASPVCGLRAVRALRSTRSKDKKPEKYDLLPTRYTFYDHFFKGLEDLRYRVLGCALSATIASTNSALFTGRLLTLR